MKKPTVPASYVALVSHAGSLSDAHAGIGEHVSTLISKHAARVAARREKLKQDQAVERGLAAIRKQLRRAATRYPTNR